MKTFLVSLSEETLEKLDEEVERIGMPSRNSLVVQYIRKGLGLPTVIEKMEEED